jgi:hypothetical protein
MGAMADFENAHDDATTAVPGLFRLGGKTFVLPPVTVEDYRAWNEAARDAVRASMPDPLVVFSSGMAEAADNGSPLTPAAVKALAEAAMAIRSAGGNGRPEPTTDQLSVWSVSLEGIRWLVFYRLAKLAQSAAGVGTVTEEWVNQHVTKATCRQVLEDITAIDKVRVAGPNQPTPAS